MDYVYKFTEAELLGIKKRREEVMNFLRAISEIRELKGDLEVSPDSLGFIRSGNSEGEK